MNQEKYDDPLKKLLAAMTDLERVSTLHFLLSLRLEFTIIALVLMKFLNFINQTEDFGNL